MKQTGILVVSLKAVNFGFWSHLWCSGHSTNIIIKPPRNTELREEKQKSNFLFQLVFVFVCF